MINQCTATHSVTLFLIVRLSNEAKPIICFRIGCVIKFRNCAAIKNKWEPPAIAEGAGANLFYLNGEFAISQIFLIGRQHLPIPQNNVVAVAGKRIMEIARAKTQPIMNLGFINHPSIV